MVFGFGSTVGEAIVTHPQVQIQTLEPFVTDTQTIIYSESLPGAHHLLHWVNGCWAEDRSTDCSGNEEGSFSHQ